LQKYWTVYVSFITELELLGFHEISSEERHRIGLFLKECIIVDLNESIKQETIRLKQNNRIKLPDAVIIATSLYMNIPLISADSNFEKINELQFIKYEKQTG
jgi:predicted nucleic acid-binding protein